MNTSAAHLGSGASDPVASSVPPSLAVIVVAAGSGSRLGLGIPKALVGLAGRSVLSRSLDGVFGGVEPAQVVVVAPPADLAEVAAIVAEAAGAALACCTVVEGGPTRQESVAAGLAVLGPHVEIVLVHDAARALTPASQFDAVAAAVRSSGAGAIPASDVVDTIKRIDASRRIVDTVDRSYLAAVQTPQGFPRALLVDAYSRAADLGEFTDDAALLAADGHPSYVVAGDALAFKITTPWDLRRAEQLVGASAAGSVSAAASAAASEVSSSGEGVAAVLSSLRTGIGIDVHAFADGEELWAAGLHWPGERGLAGHSDGDPVAHAICDALLSAADLGDLGSVFGTDDPALASAHGTVFLERTRDRLLEAGFAIVNVAVQLVGNRPRFSARRSEAAALLSGVLDAPVSVSATTTDGLGFAGRGEGLTAIATALVVRS